MALKVKAYYNYIENRQDEIRRFSVEKGKEHISTYENLNEKIIFTFPDLKDKRFKLYWKDSDNDLICFSTDEELEQALPFLKDDVFKIYISICGDASIHSNHYCKGESPLCSKRKYCKNHTDGRPFGSRCPLSFGTQPLYAHQHGLHPDIPQPQFGIPFVHGGVVCDGCDGKIIGIRYKCETCPDYDLCCTCKEKGIHSEHKFIEIHCPRHYIKQIMRHCGMGPGHWNDSKRKKCWNRNSCNKDENSSPEKSSPEQNNANGKMLDVKINSIDEHLYSIGNCVKEMLFPIGIDVEVNPRGEKSTVDNTIGNQASKEPIDVEVIHSDAKSGDASEWLMVDQEVIFPGESNNLNNSVNKKIDEATQKLMSMGFNDEGGWLTALVSATNGDVNKALDAMQANKSN